MPKEQKQPRTKIATLFGVLKWFKPEMEEGKWTGKFLVNEETLQGRNPPERDNLLHLIGEASLEIVDFMRDYDRMQTQNMQMFSALNEVGEFCNAILGTKDQHPDIQSGLDTVKGRYRQMVDIIHRIAHDVPAEKAQITALSFLAFKGNSLKPLVNQNAQEATQTNAGQSQLTVHVAPSDGVGDTCEVCGGTHASVQCPGPSRYTPPGTNGPVLRSES